MKLLFTGASGFLGNSVRPLLERTYDIVTVGLLPQDDYTINIATLVSTKNFLVTSRLKIK